MQTISALLGQVPGLRAGARADTGGNVEEVAGQIEAETACAIATMCSPHLESAAGLLQLGTLHAYSIVSDKMSMYVHKAAQGIVVATGDHSKNPDAQMKKIAQLLGDKR